MAQITLDSAQFQVVLHSHDPVRICDPAGNLLGVISPATKDVASRIVSTDEEIERAKRALAAPGPRYTTKEVLEHLRAMKPEN